MNDAKVGDKVKCVNDDGALHHLVKGKIYEVKSVSSAGDVWVDGHNGWFPDRFELVKEEPTFKVGDVVEAFGVRGVVKEIQYNNYPLLVQFEDGNFEHFKSDGKFLNWHKTPSLKLIERPKKKVKKVLERWMNVYENRSGGHYHTREEADREANIGRIACVKLTGEYEIEVDDEI